MTSSAGNVLGRLSTQPPDRVYWTALKQWGILLSGINTDVLQIAWAKQAEPLLFLFNPAVHAGASDVTPRRTVLGN